MKKFLDRNDPFFAKPLTRWLTAGLPVAWSLFEFSTGAWLWGIAFLAAGLYAGWELLWPRGRG